MSLTNDEVIRRATLETLEALPYRLKHEVEGFLHGVVVERAQQLEVYADELFQAFEGVRELVRSRHGDRITLHRGEPAQKPDLARRFLSWSPSRKMSLEFAGQEGHELLTVEVNVDDVVAVLAASHNRRYIEYLVRDRKSYHTSGRRPPLLCRVDFDVPWDGFSHELIDGMRRRLERELAAVNGRILSMHVDEENGQADAHVLVPATVHTRVDDDMIRLGEFELYSPRPYVRGLEESSERRRSRQHGETTMRIRLGELRRIIGEELTLMSEVRYGYGDSPFDDPSGADPLAGAWERLSQRKRDMETAKCSVCYQPDRPGNHLRKVRRQGEDVWRCPKHVSDL